MRALFFNGRRATPVGVPEWVRLRVNPDAACVGCECSRCGATEQVALRDRRVAEMTVGRFAVFHDQCRERIPPTRRLAPLDRYEPPLCVIVRPRRAS
jgi:hypothetical protein